MKVVLFCGGFGTRLREHSATTPKPLVNIGVRPVIWHLMRTYAHYGHTDFILCLGYRGDLIRRYFLEYQEALSNDFTLSGSCGHVELHSTDVSHWKITFVDTGLHANIAQRLVKARRYLDGEQVFLANYADGLSDLRIDDTIEAFRRRDTVAQLTSVVPQQTYHTIQATADGYATAIGPMQDSNLRINGGYFVLRHDIFEYIRPGDELVEAPFERLVQKRRLGVFRHDGFWRAMDTFKDKIIFDRMEASGECPWMVWKK